MSLFPLIVLISLGKSMVKIGFFGSASEKIQKSALALLNYTSSGDCLFILNISNACIVLSTAVITKYLSIAVLLTLSCFEMRDKLTSMI